MHLFIWSGSVPLRPFMTAPISALMCYCIICHPRGKAVIYIFGDLVMLAVALLGPIFFH